MDAIQIVQFAAKVLSAGLWVAHLSLDDKSKWSVPVLAAAVMTTVVACSDL